ncbi:thermonuclease family protein [Zobellella iuensis]|uniref:Thermonuclease family protein n=1 Tax=Zobellella iuensis TaxID=2803811 RepID=A0ABS1QMR5_9GAMM|nr:thermonuclease family protein [Zobellella iuensis]MBL1376086.1 thermonuclease family protein [Zobellella iuensis]
MNGWKYVIALLLWSWGAAAECPRLQAEEKANIRHVVDGDTVILQDGRVIRFIGIDTPEFNKHNEQPAEAGAETARRWLVNKIVKQSHLKLVFGVKRRDDYGRWLAHPLTSEGELLVTQMLAQGLGQLMLLPPNDEYWPCWLAAEQQARRARVGIWSVPLAAEPSVSGWQMFSTSVVRGYSGTGRAELLLEGNLRVTAGRPLSSAARTRLMAFKPGDRLFVRGWVRAAEKGWQLWLNHSWQFYQDKVIDCAGQC